MNCPTCGSTLTDGANFCPVCGSSITTSNNQQQTVNSQSQYQQLNSQPQYQQMNGQTSYQQMNGQPQYQQSYNQPQYQQTYGQPQYQTYGNYHTNIAKYKRKFNIGHFAVMLGSFLCLLGSFLPYLTVSAFGVSESMNLFKDGEGDGTIFLAIAIIIMILSLFRLNILNIITTCVQGAFAIYEIMDTNDKIGYLSSVINYGIGYYLLLIGSIVAFIGAIAGLVLHVRSKNEFKQNHPMM